MLELVKTLRLATPTIALAIAALAACGDDGGAPAVDAGLRSDLRIEQAPTIVEVDTELVFTIVVSNLGPDAATDAGVTTTLPAGIAVVSATCAAQGAAACGGTSTAGGASWTGLDLPVAANGSNTVTLRVIAVPTRLGSGVVTADLVVPANVVDPDPSPASNQAMRPIERQIAQLAASGGRVDWYSGTVTTGSGASRPIAFDRAPPNAATTTEVYFANPDTGTPACITCGMPFPHGAGFVGNPTWHPNGEYLVVQVENARSAHTSYNAPGWGLDSDLWMIKVDGAWAARIWTSTGVHHGALHPQFSPDGALLVFAERIATAPQAPPAMWPGTDGQDPWRGWGLRVARVDATVLGNPVYDNTDAPMITESVRLAPNEAVVEPTGATGGNGRYEPSAISAAGRIQYAFTARPGTGRPNNQYVDAAHACTLDSVTALTGATCAGVTTLSGAEPETWDDLAQAAPDGAHRSFPSSRADLTWRAQATTSLATTLRTELYLMPNADEAAATALTSMNTTRSPDQRYVVGDHRWSRDGTRIVFEVSPVAVTTGLAGKPEVWMIAVP